jgi:hypothetical protein
MRQAPNSKRYFAKALAVALVCCITLFLVQVVVHAHDKGHNEGACRVCHVAHAGSLPAPSAFVLDEPLHINGRVHENSLEFQKSFFVNDSSSRAPPAA